MGRYAILLAVLLLAGGRVAQAGDTGAVATFTVDLRADFRRHYSAHSLAYTGIGLALTGVLANTGFDDSAQDVVREDLQGRAGDDLAKLFTSAGDAGHPLISIPVYVAAMWGGNYASGSDTGLARWGADSLRATLIGAPQLLALSNIAGGQRPEEGEAGWSPFDDDDGVSGHAFFGAVPILTAAKMSDRRWLKYTLYVASTMPGWARVYDDKHFVSQSFMGWWLANAAARSVQQGNRARPQRLSLLPVPYPDGGGLQLSLRF